MKTLLLVILLLLLVPVYGVRAGRPKDRNVNGAQSSSAAQWPNDAVVSVYFVQSLFTTEEQQLLWNTIEAWNTRARTSGIEISFIARGETAGLIDCSGCLTIARQGLVTYSTRQRVSFNALRLDNAGHLVSAWIAFERRPARHTDLKSLMRQALDRGFGSTSSQLAKN